MAETSSSLSLCAAESGRMVLTVGPVSIALDKADYDVLKAHFRAEIEAEIQAQKVAAGMKSFERLVNANPMGMQALIKACTYDDMLIVMKVCETRRPVIEAFFMNMPARQRDTFIEGLQAMAKTALSVDRALAAVSRITQQISDLRQKGVLMFHDEPAPAVTRAS